MCPLVLFECITWTLIAVNTLISVFTRSPILRHWSGKFERFLIFLVFLGQKKTFAAGMNLRDWAKATSLELNLSFYRIFMTDLKRHERYGRKRCEFLRIAAVWEVWVLWGGKGWAACACLNQDCKLKNMALGLGVITMSGIWGKIWARTVVSIWVLSTKERVHFPCCVEESTASWHYQSTTSGWAYRKKKSPLL